MSPHFDPFGQPIGQPLPTFTGAAQPPRSALEGRYCRLEPIDPSQHAAPLFAALSEAPDGRSWTYLPYGPFADSRSFREWMDDACRGDDPQFFAIVDGASNRPTGLASYLRITPTVGTIEVGHLHYAPALQRTPVATEAMFLLMERAFALGYRRYEWKCDALNAPSRAAAERLGFRFEGIFRQAAVYKGRSRDTAWYSVIDQEWPTLRSAFLCWLAPANFDAAGKQRTRLSALTASEAAQP